MPSLALQPCDRLLQHLRDDAVGIDRYLLDIGLVGGEDRQGADIGGSLGEDHVSGIDEELSDNVNGLLGAGGDNNVLWIGVNALERHDLRDLLPQARQSLSVAVLERPPPVLADHLGGGVGEPVKGQVLEVGHPAGE